MFPFNALPSRFEEKFEEVNGVEPPQVMGHPNVGPSEHAMPMDPESAQNNDHAEGVNGHPLCPDFSIPQDENSAIRYQCKLFYIIYSSSRDYIGDLSVPFCHLFACRLMQTTGCSLMKVLG